MKTVSKYSVRSGTRDFLLSAVGVLLLQQKVFAHPFGHLDHSLLTFRAGLIHPISGLDHLLTALGVGVWAAGLNQEKNSSSIMIGPLSFLGGVLGGALIGQLGVELPFCEQGILLSLVLLGLCLFADYRSGFWSNVGMLFVFGAFHGNAHGREVSQGALAVSAISGFLVSTGILHGVGVIGVSLIKKVFNEERVNLFLRWAGVGLMGSAFLL